MSMKAIRITGTKDAHHISLTSFPIPVPKDKDILIKVHAAGITADEVTWPELYASTSRIPGHDISGTVESLGPSYSGPISVGDEVYAMLRASVSQGGQAEYVIAAPDEVARKPASISHVQAAALPIPVLTAWEAISEHAKLERGAKVLITGASGAVGLLLVQLARRLFDAEIIALASPRNHGVLKELGVSQAVDYNLLAWENTISDVDAVFDTVGGPTLSKTWSTVKEDGVIVTVGDPTPHWAFGRGEPDELKLHPRVKWVYFIVTARAEPLVKVASLIDEGVVKSIPIKVFEAEEGVEAWKYAARRGKEGKAVIEFVSN
ncbi:uncharacterized protein DNG_00068 [Cephalotrichum gorgonifer]|uniref:Enoyl reductase (ER) domain-containing protein n=1 Tax=Cephalotrichum gorgonifer TaxID=2041049 RepID=A0AAE8MPN3_9PEZI|nr:uncharacterized protein DNG_00068 [Cephalotrichum gorgonifer]